MVKIVKNFFKHPTSLFLTWIAFLLSPIISYFRFLYINSNSLAFPRIKGFSSFLFLLPIAINIVSLSILLFWFFEFIKGRTRKLDGRIFGLVTVVTVLFFVLVNYFLGLENANYPNYIYSKYGLTVAQLELMSFMCLFELIVFGVFYFYSDRFKKLIIKLRSKKVQSGGTSANIAEKASLMISILVVLCLVSLTFSSYFRWPTLINESQYGNEGKVGKEYKYIDLLLRTPQNAVIIHPPQGDKWPAIGNQPLIRYFLFPRTLVSGALVSTQNFATGIGEAYFPIIERDVTIGGWPQIDVGGMTIIFDEINKIDYKTLNLFHETDKGRVYQVIF